MEPELEYGIQTHVASRLTNISHKSKNGCHKYAVHVCIGIQYKLQNAEVDMRMGGTSARMHYRLAKHA